MPARRRRTGEGDRTACAATRTAHLTRLDRSDRSRRLVRMCQKSRSQPLAASYGAGITRDLVIAELPHWRVGDADAPWGAAQRPGEWTRAGGSGSTPRNHPVAARRPAAHDHR
jgi:hypothetical protein